MLALAPHFRAVAGTLGKLENTVWEFPVGTSVSHLHGCVCGLSCANTLSDREAILHTLVDLLEPEVPGISVGAGLDELDRFTRLTWAELGAEDLSFQPLLSDDDSPLADRLGDLATWCGGFLLGFGVAARADELTGTEREILDDIVRISQVDSDSDPDPHADFELFDVVEHLRMAVLLLHSDEHTTGAGADNDNR